MNGIIKSSDLELLSVVRTMDRDGGVDVRVGDARHDMAAHRIAALEDELARRDGMIEALRADVVAAVSRGEALGLERGKKAAVDKQSERVAVLSKNLVAATAMLADSLKETERLALTVARITLEKLFGQSGGQSKLVADLLKVQIAELGKSTNLHITVSGQDFSGAALDDLKAAFGSEHVILCSDPALPPGGCVLRPRLGQLDIGLNTQWSAIRALLDDLAEHGAPA